MSKPLKLAIIGCGMASGKLMEELVLRDANRFHITVIGDEPEGNYDRIRLTSILHGKTPPRFYLHDSKWLEANRIEARLGESAIAVDLANRTVVGDKGSRLSYDRLVFAAGSRAFVPPIKGADTPGVFTLRNLGDVRAISSFIENKSRVTVMGGGVLGLELADVLSDLGKTVSISHLMPDLMEQQLSSEPAAVLEKLLINSGICVQKENPIVAVSTSENGALILSLKNGDSEETDLLIINCGIVPNAALAREAGLSVRRGIVVNDRLQTSDSTVFAVGECAEIKGRTVGLLAPVYAEAKCLAAILLGDEEIRYQESVGISVKLKSRIPAVAMGKLAPEAGDTAIVYDNPQSLIYKRLIVQDNRLVGATLVGDHLNADAVSGYFASNIPLPKKIESLLFPGVKKAEEVTQAVYWPGTVNVCDCNSISCDTVRGAIRSLGPDVARISEVTGAGQSCGTCISRVSAIVENTFDAVVVGSGLGGLTAAANLSRHKKRVLVIEQHDKPGGYATSFTRDGFTFDASLHNLGPLHSSILRIFENLGLLNEVEYIPYNCFSRIVFPENDFALTPGIDRFEDYLISMQPAEEQGIRAFFGEMRKVRQGFFEMENITFEADSDEVLSPLMAAKYPEFVEWMQTTLGELLDSHIKDAKVKAAIGNMWWYMGLPPSEMPALLFPASCLSYIECGGGYIKGTSQQLSSALARKVTEAGGKVLLNTKVTRILVSNDKVDGVVTDGGEMFYTDLVLSNAGAHETFVDLVDESQVKKKYRNKILRQDNALSAVQLYLGLDCPPESLGLQEHSLTVFSSYDHDENMRFILDGDYEKTPFSLMVYSAVDASTAPKGKCVVNIFSLENSKNWEGLPAAVYEEKKRQVTAIVLRKAERFIPDLSKHIIVSELGTPRTMHRYTGHLEGSIYGQAQNIYQSGLSRLQSETPVGGLYLVGSAIYPGGGYPSVINSGYRTAHKILRSLRPE
jgi:phytoene desaturase